MAQSFYKTLANNMSRKAWFLLRDGTYFNWNDNGTIPINCWCDDIIDPNLGATDCHNELTCAFENTCPVWAKHWLKHRSNDKFNLEGK